MTTVDIDMTINLPAGGPCRTVRVVLAGLDRARCPDVDLVALADQFVAQVVQADRRPLPPIPPPTGRFADPAAHAAADPVDQPPAPKPTPARSARGGRPAHAPGTCGWELLTALADDDGTYHGAIPDFCTEVWPRSAAGAAKVIGKSLVDAGLVTLDRASPRRVTAIHLTEAGWAHLGRTAPDRPVPPTAPRPAPERPVSPTSLSPDPAPPPDIQTDEPTPPPLMPELGPIERRTFDADAARSAAGAAL